MHRDGSVCCVLLFVLSAIAFLGSASAQTYTVLYNFNPNSGGYGTNTSLIVDASGNVYGTAPYGGDPSCNGGCGTVFKVDPQGNQTVLHAFVSGAGDGFRSQASLVMDPQGNLYGTTSFGGASGFGTLFKLDPNHNETILYSFTGGADGNNPTALTIDPDGNIFGITAYGGIRSLKACGNNLGCGVLYKFSGSTFAILHQFHGGKTDGFDPFGAPVLDSAGNIYGATESGPTLAGTVYRYGTNGKYAVEILRGGNPPLGLSRSPTGYFYFPASGGSAQDGEVVQASPAGKLLATFNFGGDAGQGPEPELIFDPSGNVYGTTNQGGSTDNGVIFELSQQLAETVLFTPTDPLTQGQNFNAGLARDAAGNLYGVTYAGGQYGYGTVFKFSPQ